jgi:hypothetical protein
LSDENRRKHPQSTTPKSGLIAQQPNLKAFRLAIVGRLRQTAP